MKLVYYVCVIHLCTSLHTLVLSAHGRYHTVRSSLYMFYIVLFNEAVIACLLPIPVLVNRFAWDTATVFSVTFHP